MWPANKRANENCLYKSCVRHSDIWSAHHGTLGLVMLWVEVKLYTMWKTASDARESCITNFTIKTIKGKLYPCEDTEESNPSMCRRLAWILFLSYLSFPCLIAYRISTSRDTSWKWIIFCSKCWSWKLMTWFNMQSQNPLAWLVYIAF